MEDYLGAFNERSLDTDALMKERREIGSVHMGAITIECLLKALIIERFCIDNWNINSNGVAHGITNPGHNLIEAIHAIPELRRRIPQNIVDYINVLQSPHEDYIDMRYCAGELNEDSYQNWFDSYRRLKAWLINQRPYLHSIRRR